MRETACSLCDGLWICEDVCGGCVWKGWWWWGLCVCACVLKPQAMKLCVYVCVSHYVYVVACVCISVCVCVCMCRGRKSVGECRRQTCQFHSWFLWLQGSGRSRVTLGITAPQHRAWGKLTIIYRSRQMYTHTHTLVGCPHP